VFYASTDALAHRAANALGGEETEEVKIEWSLNELSSMGEPIARPFQVPNSDAHEPANVELLYPLYTRQAKALTRMLDIENGKVIFSEEERAEENLPGVGVSTQCTSIDFSIAFTHVVPDIVSSF
jgi:hypothetical protein